MKLQVSLAALALIMSANLVPASAAPQRGVGQAEYEEFMECLGVAHARNDMFSRLAGNVTDKAYAEQLKAALSGVTKSLVSLKGLIEKANPGLDVVAGEAARYVARSPYDDSDLQPYSTQLDIFLKGHNEGGRTKLYNERGRMKLYTDECRARIDAMLEAVEQPR